MNRRLATLRRCARSPAGILGLSLLLLHLLVAILAPAIVPYSPSALHADQAFQPPSQLHLFGTDQFGRDILSRVLVGGREAMVATAIATTLAIVIGGFIGIWLGYSGFADELVMRLVDAIQAMPALLFYLAVVTVFGSGSVVLVLALAFTNLPGIIRVSRAATLELVAADYIAAARARGEGTVSIVVSELWPNVQDVLLVEAAMRASWILLAVSALSFLGIGVSPTTPAWGLMVAENRSRLALAPWASVFPAAAISSLVVGMNLTADALARALGRNTGDGR
jgi:peptide/nickel transport system permease protein